MISATHPIRFGHQTDELAKAAETLRKHLPKVPLIHGTRLPGKAFILIGVRNQAELTQVKADLAKIKGVTVDPGTGKFQYGRFPISLKDGIQTLQ